MARISTYKIDNNITQDDIVIGSDADNFFQTKNYKVSDIINSIQQGVVNNIPKVVTVVLGVGESIENSLSEINLTIEPSDSPVFINFLKPTLVDSELGNNLEYRKISYFFPLGNGVYEPISSYISFNDLILNNFSLPTLSDVQLLQDTQVIEAGNITGQNISDWLNSQIPSLDLSNENLLYVFSYEDNGVQFFTTFNGTSGVYGLNDSQSNILDFISLTNSEFLNFEEKTNIKIRPIEITPSNPFYASVTDELNEVVSKFNNLPSFEIKKDEIGMVYAEYTNPQGVTYINKYFITRGKGNYGINGFQISNTLINIAKIEDGFASQNLSNYINDANFITSSEIPTVEVPTDVSVFNNDANYVNQTELSNSLPFKGEYASISEIGNISNPSDGDYALFYSGNIQQFWIKNSKEWELQSSKNFFNEISSNYTISILDHNSTIIANSGVEEITLETIPKSIEILIINNSESNISLISVGTTIIGSNEILDGQSAYVSFDSLSNKFYVKKSSAESGTRIATYNYVNSNLSFQTISQGVEFPPQVDGQGVGFKDPLQELPDVFDTTGNYNFFLSKLKVGDIVNVQVLGKFNVTTANTNINGNFYLAKGEFNEVAYELESSFYPITGQYTFNKSIEFVVASIDSVVFDVEMLFSSTENVGVYFNNVYVKIISKA